MMRDSIGVRVPSSRRTSSAHFWLARLSYGERAADRVPNPPGRVRREAVSAGVIEALDGLHEADVALLDEIDERQPAAVVTASDRNDEAEIGLHEAVFRVVLADERGLDLV